jgi:hypothetical protein
LSHRHVADRGLRQDNGHGAHRLIPFRSLPSNEKSDFYLRALV